MIPATKNEDEKAKIVAKNVLANDYNLLCSSCATLVQSALDNAGKKSGNLSFFDTLAAQAVGGAFRLQEEKEPNKIYQRIKTQNKNGKVVKPKK